ncbi:MAG: hypothetical protein IT435_07890 [Phycisphaerales bacterium]|nr:hypothetical protein [Phycisphaerales bacterium]
MPRPSDLFKNTGTGNAAPTPPKSTINLNAPPADAKKSDQDSIAAHKPDKGHTLHAPAKAQGGAGGSSARPKV